MERAIDNFFPLRLTVYGELEPIFFASIEQFVDWSRKELEVWKKTPFGDLWGVHFPTRAILIDEPARDHEVLKELQEGSKKASDLSVFDTVVAKYKNAERFAAESKLGQLILQAFLINNKVATIAVCGMANRLGQKSGDDDRLKPLEDDARTLVERWRRTLTRDAIRSTDHGDLNETLRAIRDEIAKLHAVDADLRADILARFVEKELSDPSKQWRGKAGRHLTQMKVYIVLFLVLIAAAVGLDLAILKYFADQLPSDPIAKGILFVALGGTQLWIITVPLRLFYVAQHLSEDATERQVMMDSLISMARQAELKGDMRERVIPQAFETLFRPAVKGVISDGSHPLDLNKAVREIAGGLKAKSGV